MTDPRTCAHADTVPVEVRDPTTGAVETVAYICMDCYDELPAGWGCSMCEWVEAPRRLCDPTNTTDLVLARPCKEHS